MAIAGIELFGMLDSSSSSNEEVSPQTMDSFVNTVPALDDDEFRQHFRLRRDTFELVLNATDKRVSNEFRCHSGRATVPVSQQLLMTLWMLATPDSYRYRLAGVSYITCM